jgi:predicted acylesterase/phospholipase RssA
MLSLNLAGGGSRGSLQWGMIKALVDKGIVPDMVFGASVGALNACLYLQGDIPAGDRLWLEISNKKVYNFYPWDILSLLINKNHVFDSSPLKKLIDTVIDHKKLLASPIKLQIVVTNLTNWTTEAYSPQDVSEQEFKTLLLASASPPMAFAPVEFRGCLYADGGVINNYCVGNAVKAGAEKIIVMSPTVREETKVKNELDMFGIMTSLPEYSYLDREILFINKINQLQVAFPDYIARKIDHILIRPDKPTGLGLLDFNYKDKQKWIDFGYSLADKALQDFQ